jgi:hypothetical protein
MAMVHPPCAIHEKQHLAVSQPTINTRQRKECTFLQVLSLSGLSKCISLFLQRYAKALSRKDGTKEKFLMARPQAGRLHPRRIWRWFLSFRFLTRSISYHPL